MAFNWNPIAPLRPVQSDDGLVIHYIAWTPTSEDSWKLNFFGCIDDVSGKAGAGCVLRDQNAFFKHAVSAPVTGCTSTIEVELFALRNGLLEAIKLGVDYVEVEGESETAMMLILGQESPSTELAEVLAKECNSIIKSFQMVCFHPVCAYANRAARKLAKCAVEGGNLVHWSKEPPPAISEILVEDVIGRYEFSD